MATNGARIDSDDLIHPHHYGTKGVPHDVWTELRAHAPVYRCEPSEHEPFWAITKHADIMDISGRPDVFSNTAGPVILSRQQLADRRNPENPLATLRTIIEMDPPEHRDFRKVASGMFTPRGVQHLERLAAESARALIDGLGAEGECDFVERIAQRHPLRILAQLLGIDRDDEERVLELTQQLFAGDDPDLQRKGEDRSEAQKQLGIEFYQLFDRIVQDRRANPRDDLATKLATGVLPDGSAMGPLETFGYYLIVFTAGHDTTRNALAGGLAALIENPDQLAALRGHPERAKAAVEEVVRWVSPVNYMRRLLLRDVELHGQKLAKGDSLVMFYASANRDEDVFDAPFRFDISRHPNRHLGFGTGEHFCLGAHVARMSSRKLLEEIANRVEVLEPAASPSQIESSFVVGLKSLPVRYRFRPATAA